MFSLFQNLLLKMVTKHLIFERKSFFSLFQNLFLKIWSQNIWYLNLPWFKDLKSNPQVSTAFFPTVGICIGICWHHFIGRLSTLRISKEFAQLSRVKIMRFNFQRNLSSCKLWTARACVMCFMAVTVQGVQNYKIWICETQSYGVH